MKRFLPFAMLVFLSLACTIGQAATPTISPSPLAPQPSPIASPSPPATSLLSPFIPCDSLLCPYATINLLGVQNRPLNRNVLKLFSAAANPANNRIYVAGIMTAYIAILDGASEQWIGMLDTGMSNNFTLKYLYVDPVANYLYVLDGSHSELRRIHLSSGEIVGPVKIGEGQGFAAVDTARARIYLPSRDAPYFSAYDGKTLQLVYSTNALGEGTGRPIYDAQADAVYVLDNASQAAQRNIYRLDPSTGEIASTIVYSAPEGQRASQLDWDAVHQRFFVATGKTLLIIGADGSAQQTIPLPREMELSSLAYEPNHDRLAALFIERPAEGEVAGVGGVLLVFDPAAGREITRLTFGDKPHRLALSTANDHFYVANADASVVWSIPTDSYAAATPLRLGDSAEQVVLTNGGNTFYVNSRLGGSYLMSFNVDTGAYETFTSGVWPVPIRTDASGKRLFVLNAWDSTLSVYALDPQRSLLATIPIGLPRGTTDRLPDLAIDSTHKMAYAAYPEFGKIAVLDWNSLASTRVLTVEGFPAGEGSGGPGNLQVAVDEASSRLFVLWAEAPQRLQVYDAAAGYTLLSDIDLSGLKWQLINQAANTELMALDAEKGRLFIGPFEFDLASLQATGRMLERGARIVAVDTAAGVYWASGIEQDNNIVAILDRETLAARDVEDLGEAHTMKPAFAFDPARRLLYVADPQLAEIQVFFVNPIP